MATDHARLQAKIRQVEDMLEEAKRQLHWPNRPLAERAAGVLSGLDDISDLLLDLCMEDD